MTHKTLKTMKKLTLTLALLFSVTLCMTAQNDAGLFGRGVSFDESSDYANNTRNGIVNLPTVHGETKDVDATSPLSSGIVVLAALGAAYAFGRKRREE